MKSHLYAAVAAIMILVGCCEPSLDRTNGIHQTLLTNPVMQFVDSAGNELVLFYDGRDWIDLPGYVDEVERETPCEPRAHMYSAKFVSGPDQRFGFNEYVFGWLRFENIGCPTVCGPTVDAENATYSITIQGNTYLESDIHYADTSQTVPSFIFDLEYGIVLMAKEGEYRWERVLNP